MTDQSEKRHSASWGAMAIAGTIIGGGMFVSPVDPAGAWLFRGIFILIIAWFSMLHSRLLLLEINLNHPVGSSFNTITKDLIGSTWSIIGGITVAFALYILTYTHISANGAIISETISVNLGHYANPRIIGICTIIFVVSVLWMSSLATSRITLLFFGLKIISLVIAFGSFFFRVKYSILHDFTSTTTGAFYLPYIFMTLPVYLASFGSYGNIPSLIICYGKCEDRPIKSVVFSSLLALVIYLFWLYCTMEDIPRGSFKAIISSGGNVDSLVRSFLGTRQHGITEFCLLMFSDLAVASSLLGVMLGLLDYLADLLKIDNSHGGRFKAVLLTFLPPALLYLISPNDFVHGISGAGLCVTIWVVIIPAVLVIRACKRFPNQILTAWGGSLIPAVVILSSITAILYRLGSVFNVLPKFG